MGTVFPIPCIYPLGLPVAADSLASSDILFHISSAFWLVPAECGEKHVREDHRVRKCFPIKFLAF
jgi:hypothetical protein